MASRKQQREYNSQKVLQYLLEIYISPNQQIRTNDIVSQILPVYKATIYRSSITKKVPIYNDKYVDHVEVRYISNVAPNILMARKIVDTARTTISSRRANQKQNYEITQNNKIERNQLLQSEVLLDRKANWVAEVKTTITLTVMGHLDFPPVLNNDKQIIDGRKLLEHLLSQIANRDIDLREFGAELKNHQLDTIVSLIA